MNRLVREIEVRRNGSLVGLLQLSDEVHNEVDRTTYSNLVLRPGVRGERDIKTFDVSIELRKHSPAMPMVGGWI